MSIKYSLYGFGLYIKRAFDEFTIRWIPPVPLVYPQPAALFFLWCSLTGINPADPLASMLAD